LLGPFSAVSSTTIAARPEPGAHTVGSATPRRRSCARAPRRGRLPPTGGWIGRPSWIRARALGAGSAWNVACAVGEPLFMRHAFWSFRGVRASTAARTRLDDGTPLH
jgi:hypothetical protein